MSHAYWKTDRSTLEGANEEYDELYEEARLADELAQQIYDRRVELGLSQTQLAERAGMKQPHISRLEGGGTLPTLPVLRRLAHALEMDLHVGFTAPTASAEGAGADVPSDLEGRLANWLVSTWRDASAADVVASYPSRWVRHEVGTFGIALWQLKASSLASQAATDAIRHNQLPVEPHVQVWLERIREVLDTAVHEVDDEVRWLEDAHR